MYVTMSQKERENMSQPSKESVKKYQDKIYRPQFSLSIDETKLARKAGVWKVGDANKIAKKLFLEYLQKRLT